MPDHDSTYVRKVIKDFPGYYVDTEGNVWTRWKRKGWVCGRGCSVILGSELKKLRFGFSAGYKRVTLYREGKHYHRLVHRLVLEAFVGPCPEGMEACHYPDSDRLNCRLDNLRWDTHLNNARDARMCGGYKTKLTEENVLEMRRKYQPDVVTCQMLADEFGVSQSVAWNAIAGKTWKHLGNARGYKLYKKTAD